MGDRPIYIDRELLIDNDDAALLEVNTKVIFLKLGLCLIKEIVKNENNYHITIEYLPEDNDFKKKQAVNFLAKK